MDRNSIVTIIKNHKKATLVLLAIVLVGGYLLISQNRKPTGFYIVATNPRLSEIKNLTPFIKLYLSEPTTKENVSIDNQSTVRSYEVADKTVTIYLNALDKGKRYTVTIASIRSTQGSVLTNKKLSFTAKEGSWEKLPADQKEAVLKVQDEKPATSTDPILAYVPHQTPNYVLSALVSDSELRLVIKVTPSFADTQDDGTIIPETLERYKNEALDYIRSQKLDPAKYKIDVTQDNPYLNPN